MSAPRPPTRWSDLPFALPSSGEDPGTVLALPDGRLIVRTYDTNESFANLTKSDDRYQLDIADLRLPEEEEVWNPQVGDTIMYLGAIRTDDETNLWHPMRVVHVDSEVREKSGGHHGLRATYRRTWCVEDLWAESRFTDDSCVPKHLLGDGWPLISDLAGSGRAATVEESRALLSLFGCEAVLERKRGWQ